MQQDTYTTEQKRKSISGLWLLLLAVLAYLYFFSQPERTRRHQRTRLQQDAEVSKPLQDQQTSDESSEEDEFNERPETGDLDF